MFVANFYVAWATPGYSQWCIGVCHQCGMHIEPHLFQFGGGIRIRWCQVLLIASISRCVTGAGPLPTGSDTPPSYQEKRADDQRVPVQR